MHKHHINKPKSGQANNPNAQPIQRMATITIGDDDIIKRAALNYAPKSKTTDFHRNTYNKYGRDTSNLPIKKLDQLLSYEELKKNDLKIENDEEINILAHGTNPHTGDDALLGGRIPKTLADRLAPKLPKDYRGTIWLNGCHTAIRGRQNKPSFIEQFVERMKKKGFQNITVKANFGSAATVARRDSVIEKVFITDPLVANLYRQEGELLKTPKGESYVESPNGVLKYKNGIYMMPGIQKEVVFYHGFTIKPDPETPKKIRSTPSLPSSLDDEDQDWVDGSELDNQEDQITTSTPTPASQENIGSNNGNIADRMLNFLGRRRIGNSPSQAQVPSFSPDDPSLKTENWDTLTYGELGINNRQGAKRLQDKEPTEKFNFNINFDDSFHRHLNAQDQAARKKKKRFSFW